MSLAASTLFQIPLKPRASISATAILYMRLVNHEVRPKSTDADELEARMRLGLASTQGFPLPRGLCPSALAIFQIERTLVVPRNSNAHHPANPRHSDRQQVT